MKDITSRDFR